jgi:hypothetical protein
MPQRQHKPAQPIAVDRKPKRRYAYQLPASIAEAVRGGTRERLKELLDEFQQKGWPEEHRFMLGILENWENGKGGSTRRKDDFEVPLHYAIADELSGYWNHLVSVPDDKMVGPVEEFIASLVREGLPPASAPDMSEIRKRRIEDLKEILERDFASQASDEDVYTLESVLSQWLQLADYGPKERPEYTLQSAFQMYVDGENWLVAMKDYKAPKAEAILRIMRQGGTWLVDLLEFIGEQGIENLSPCLVASKAAGMQEAWNKARDAAA